MVSGRSLLLVSEADPNERSPERTRLRNRGKSEWVGALLAAIETGSAARVGHALQMGGDSVINEFTKGHTPLIIACSRKGSEAIVRMLLDYGAILDAASKADGSTALMASSFNGDRPCVRRLIEAGSSLNLATLDGRTALFLSCMNGHSECASLLLAAGADCHKAAERGCATPLIISCVHGFARCTHLLLDANADPEQGTMAGLSPLGLACSRGHSECVHVLSSYGARRDRVWHGDGSSLGWQGDLILEHSRLFLERAEEEAYRPADNIEECEAICAAKGHADLAKWLRSSRGWTPLHHIEWLTVERATALLRAGADLSAPPLLLRRSTNATLTPLDRAKEHARTEVGRLLLDANGPWTPRNHHLQYPTIRARAVALTFLGYQLARLLWANCDSPNQESSSSSTTGEATNDKTSPAVSRSPGAFLDVWTSEIMPLVIKPCSVCS